MCALEISSCCALLRRGVCRDCLRRRRQHPVRLGPAPSSVFSSPTPTPPHAQEALRNIEEKFPEAIDTLARAVRAGHAFTTALEMIANEVAEPVAGEFRQLYEEQKFGLPVRDALINLAERLPLVDVKFFVTAVMLQRETGGNLAEILDNLSYVIRERFKILRQVRVHTAQGRLTMVLLMALPPTIVVIMQILNPGFIRPLFADPIGHALIVGGITLQTLGYFVIRRIIRISGVRNNT